MINSRRTVETDRRRGWSVPVMLLSGVLILVGLLYVFSDGSRTTTANNNSGTATTTTPAPMGGPASPNASVPGPTTTAPAPNR